MQINYIQILINIFIDYCNADNPYLNENSIEINSTEFGQKPGSKGTTCPCGWTNKAFNRIVGGVVTDVNEFPFIAAIGSRNPFSIFCGGTIISEYHILTAAHCVFEWNANRLAIVVGEHDVSKGDESKATEVINVRRQSIHEDYSPFGEENDIALLHLERKITFTKLVGPACLPRGPIDLIGKYIKVLGWGDTFNNGRPSEILRKVNLRVIPLEICEKYFEGIIPLDIQKQLCTFSKGKDSCQGDSGGPLIWLDPETNRYTLVGIVSFGDDCASEKPGVSTDVSRYLEWITKKMKETLRTGVVCTKS